MNVDDFTHWKTKRRRKFLACLDISIWRAQRIFKMRSYSQRRHDTRQFEKQYVCSRMTPEEKACLRLTFRNEDWRHSLKQFSVDDSGPSSYLSIAWPPSMLSRWDYQPSTWAAGSCCRGEAFLWSRVATYRLFKLFLWITWDSRHCGSVIIDQEGSERPVSR